MIEIGASAQLERSRCLTLRYLDRALELRLNLLRGGAQRGQEPSSKPAELGFPERGPATHRERLIGDRQPGLGVAGCHARLELDAHQHAVEAGGRGVLAEGVEDDASHSRGCLTRPATEQLEETGE